MRKNLVQALCFLCVLLLFSAARAHQNANQQDNAELQKVLDQMDRTAANFHTTQADFVWTQYSKVVDDVVDNQKGTIYFRRSGDDVEMAATISNPTSPEYVLFTAGKVQVYKPRVDNLTIYDVGKDRAAFESMLVLGFGGSGHDMLKSFDVKYLGAEKLDGIEAAKLDLAPKSTKVRNNFNKILLWIDPQRGISVQQQLFTPDGDYRLAKYSNIRINEKISDSVFKLKTTKKTEVISPKG